MEKVKKVNLKLHWWLPGLVRFRLDPGQEVELFFLDLARSRKIKAGVSDSSVWIRTPNFKSEQKLVSWVKNNLPKRKLEKLLTASQGRPFRIEKILI